MKWLAKWLKKKAKNDKSEYQKDLEQEEAISLQSDEQEGKIIPCNSYKKGRWQEESINTNFSVCVSLGFIPKEDEFLCLNIGFDTQLLDYTREKKDALACIRLGEAPGEQEKLICRTQIVKVRLEGLLIGNITLSVFKPVEDLTLQNEHYEAKTAFCKTQCVPIDMMLGIRCLECEFAPLPAHEIYIIVNNPYLVKPDGEKVYAYDEGETIWEQAPLNKEFVKQFDGETIRIIYIPLTIGVDFEHIVDQTIKVVDGAYKNAFPMDGASISIVTTNDDKKQDLITKITPGHKMYYVK